jgi:hypothetical protein
LVFSLRFIWSFENFFLSQKSFQAFKKCSLEQHGALPHTPPAFKKAGPKLFYRLRRALSLGMAICAPKSVSFSD